MPPKQPSCKGCGKKLKPVPMGNGWAHKQEEHWADKPHKAEPAPA